MRFLIPLIVLTGCATASSDISSREAELAEELSTLTAGEPVDCVDARGNQSLDITSADTLVLRDLRATWVNRLPAACPGLRPMDLLVVEPTMSGRYCRNDQFRSVQRGSTIPGAVCRLGTFTPYRRPS